MVCRRTSNMCYVITKQDIVPSQDLPLEWAGLFILILVLYTSAAYGVRCMLISYTI